MTEASDVGRSDQTPVEGKRPMPLVLVADDEKDLCELLSLWLRDRCQVMVAFDGDDALTIAHRCSLDAALIDVMMPRLSGFGLLWAFTHHPRLVTLPVAFMTAYTDTARVAPMGRMILHKPFRKEQLERVLHELLRQEHALTRPRAEPVEQRRTQRVEVDFEAMLDSPGMMVSGRLLSLSLLGAFFQSQEPLAVGSHWRLKFRRRGVLYDIPVEAIHNMDRKGERGVGLAMHDLGLEGEGNLERLLEELLPAVSG